MKKTLCVLLSLLLLLGMTSLAQADEAMTLRLWVRYDDDFSACIADFEALHPGVKIIQEQVGNNYDDLLAKYNTGMQSNDMPTSALPASATASLSSMTRAGCCPLKTT